MSKAAHVEKMLDHARSRIISLNMDRQRAGDDALALCLGYEQALLDAGVIPNMSPLPFLIAIRGVQAVWAEGELPAHLHEVFDYADDDEEAA